VGSFPQVAGRDEISKVIARVLGKLTGRKGKGHHEQCPNVDGGVNHLEKYKFVSWDDYSQYMEK